MRTAAVTQTCDLDATADGTDSCPSGGASVAASAATILYAIQTFKILYACYYFASGHSANT